MTLSPTTFSCSTKISLSETKNFSELSTPRLEIKSDGKIKKEKQ